MLAVFALDVVIFAAEVIASGDSLAALRVPSHVAMALGANYANAALYEGRLETLLTSAFIHWSFVHIVFNLGALAAIGPRLERAVGSGRVASMYVGAAIVGSMFSTLDGWLEGAQRVGGGASGAICGLIGAAAVVGYRGEGWRSPLVQRAAWLFAVVLAFGFSTSHTDNPAHAGGVITGILFAAAWDRGDEPRATHHAGLAVAAIAIALSAGAVAIRDVVDPFATHGVGERLAMADVALRQGRCDDAWAAARAARRVAQRDPEARHAVEAVRDVCGQRPHAFE